jgi:hypothetical protein
MFSKNRSGGRPVLVGSSEVSYCFFSLLITHIAKNVTSVADRTRGGALAAANVDKQYTGDPGGHAAFSQVFEEACFGSCFVPVDWTKPVCCSTSLMDFKIFRLSRFALFSSKDLGRSAATASAHPLLFASYQKYRLTP